MPETDIVCVLGMHRSGSSLLAQVLVGNGFALGPRVVGASSTNPMGHYEDRFVVNVNKRLLARFGGTWDRPPALPDGWLADPVVKRELERARVYRERVVAQHPRFLFKDPRVCLLLPFWREAFGELRYAITFRSRDEVVRSIADRQALWLSPRRRMWRFGRYISHRLQRAYEPLRPISPAAAAALWDRYYGDALEATRGCELVTVHYERLVVEPVAEAERVVRRLRGDSATVETGMIRGELNHGRRAGSVTDETLAWEARFLAR